MKYLKIIICHLLILAFLAICLGNQISNQKSSSNNQFYEKLDLFVMVLTIIQNSYYEPISSKDLIYGALKGTLSSLDPHSQFLTPELYEDIKIDTGGHFGGLGLEIILKDDHIHVISPVPGSPADEAGILSGDHIVQIGDKPVDDKDLDQSVKKLRGPIGTEVELTIFRPSSQEYFRVNLIRQEIQIKSIKKSCLIDNNQVGYIKVSQFQEGTAEEFKEAKSILEQKGMKGLIVDLRNNPGGLLDEAIEMAGSIVGGNKLVVFTKGRLPEQNVKKISSPALNEVNYPLIVLINGGSASGSEIVSGAVQDYKKGVILGVRSFGKASVQSLIPLKDKSAIRLTTARYYTPKGRLIHEKGIQPDVKVKLSLEDLGEMKKRRKSIREGKNIKDPVFLDSQIKSAVNIIHGFRAVQPIPETPEPVVEVEATPNEEPVSKS